MPGEPGGAPIRDAAPAACQQRRTLSVRHGRHDGLLASQVANPDLKWETSEQINFGIDYGFSDDRFTGSIEIYQKKTKDLLLDVPVPQPAVVATRLENIGSLRNRGRRSDDRRAACSPRRSRSLSRRSCCSVERNEVTEPGRQPHVHRQPAT